MPSIFNPEQFLQATMDTPLEKRDPLPVGNPESPDSLYRGLIKEVKSRVWEGKTEKSAGRSGIAWDVTIEMDVPVSLVAGQGTAKRILSDSIMLDLNEGGMIDTGKGKNGRLRMYREAVDLNKPGDSFSALKMVGRPIAFKLEHELYNEAIQERVKQVLRA